MRVSFKEGSEEQNGKCLILTSEEQISYECNLCLSWHKILQISATKYKSSHSQNCTQSKMRPNFIINHGIQLMEFYTDLWVNEVFKGDML